MSTDWINDLTRRLRQRLASGSALQRAVSNIAWLVLDKVFRTTITVVVSVWIARYLGPAQFGELNYAISVAALFGAFAMLGLDRILLVKVAESPGDEATILGTAGLLRAGGGIAAVAFVALSATFVRPDDGHAFLLSAIITANYVFMASDVIDVWFAARMQARNVVLVRNLSSAVMAAAKIGLIIVGAPLVAFAAAILVESAIAALGLFLIYRAAGGRITSWRVRIARMAALLRNGWPFMAAGVATAVYMKADTIMLRQWVGADAAGIYSAAVRISEVLYLIPMAIISGLIPVLARWREQSMDRYYRHLQSVFDGMVGLSLVIALSICLLSPLLIRLAYGSRYAAAAPVLAIHVWSAAFVFLGVAQTPWLISEGKTSFAMMQTGLGAIVSLTLNWFLIPSFGAVGCAVAAIFSQASAAFLANALTAGTRKVFFMQSYSLSLRGLLKMSSSM